MTLEQLREIPYFEYRAINQLVDAHQEVFGKKLRAVVAFGPLLTQQGSFDIELLEVVDEYLEDRMTPEFGSTAALPLRGKLRLFFLSTAEFEDTDGLTDSKMQVWVQNLLERVRAGYEVIYQSPAGFADRVLHSSVPASLSNPPD